MSKRTEIDADQRAARVFVDVLHGLSEYLIRDGSTYLASYAAQLADAATLLDFYQSGLALATPSALTGCALVQWVSIYDELPEEGMRVLVSVAEWGCMTAIYVDEDLEWELLDGSNDDEPAHVRNITHWAALPNSPQKLPATVAPVVEEAAA
jgi:hypothetical protein